VSHLYWHRGEASENRLWKSVHILTGSIIEAILADYLIAIDYKKTKKIDPLEMDLFNLIQACNKEGILTDKTVGLCNVIRIKKIAILRN
jgi:hypothetical protein